MEKSKFFDQIKFAKEEKEVEFVYNQGITLYFLKDEQNKTIKHPFKCDGLIDKGLFLRLLIEYKYNEDLHNSVSRAKILIQVIYYLKQFELNGERLPNVVMVGDINEVFVMHTNSLLNYLDENINWNFAPSNAHLQSVNQKLIEKIAKDEQIQPYVYDINENFSFKEVVDKITEIATNTIRKVRVTEHNISKIFDDFTQRVLKNSDKIATNDLVGIFISSIIDKNNCYKHPNNENTLVSHNKLYQINGKYYDTFFKYFEKEYSPEDKNKFTGISDRLIEDTKRRRSGEFYTPTLFADYAHKMLAEELGEDWKEKYVVWDCCWGTGNLTRDYRFKELYASTLEQAELNCGNRYNTEATKFVFDFLNEDISNLFGCKLPPNLYKALEENKPIVFFINPPYATASSNMGKGKDQGKGNGACNSKIYDEMVEKNLKEACKNWFSQFMYRIYQIKEDFKLSNIAVGLFCKPIYLSGTTFKDFRKLFLNEFEYKQGILFNASYFADVSDKWGINFTVWKNGETKNKEEFLHTLIEEKDSELIKIGTKVLYNLDNLKTAKDWIKEPLSVYKNNEKIKMPPLSSGVTVNIGANSKTSIFKNSIGCYLNVGNDVYNSVLKTVLFTSCDNSNANGISIMPENFKRITATFSARKLVFGTWINDKDNFLQPNENHEKYDEFINDSIIFSLFHSASNQSALHDIEYKNKKWNIKNEFFYMSKKEIMNLANKYNYDFTYNDANISEDRYVYKLLKNTTLSLQAQYVLDKAIELTKKSFQSRELFDKEFPKYQVMNWDCGWYQTKAILKEYYKQDLEDFSKLYKTLTNKMRPLVYELGFLK